MENIKIAIPSINRADEISNLTLRICRQMKYPIFIFVNSKEQAEEYKKVVGDDVTIVPCNKKGISKARNAILDYFKEGDKVIQMDDDIVSINILRNKKIEEIEGIKLEVFIEKAFEDLESNKFNLWGVYPVPNHFYMNDKVSNNNFIIGTFCGVIIDEIRYDEKLFLKEDYDFTLSHIKKAGVLRYDFVAVKAKHYVNKGGACDYRDNLSEQKSILLLKNKWGDFIRDNPRRENEILLKRNI